MSNYQIHHMDATEANAAAVRLEAAARSANEAVYRLEESIRQLRMLTEEGWGNQFCEMLELLKGLKTKDLRIAHFPETGTIRTEMYKGSNYDRN